MYLTILKGQVKPENWAALANTFSRSVKRCPEDLIQCFLVQDDQTPVNWEIIEIWRSRESYEKAQAEGLTSPCVQLFSAHGQPPQRSHSAMIRSYIRV